MPISAVAGDLGNVGSLTQDQFNLLSKDIGSALSYHGGSAGATLSLPGLDLTYSFGASRIQNRAVWEQAWTSGSVPTYLPPVAMGLSCGITHDAVNVSDLVVLALTQS